MTEEARQRRRRSIGGSDARIILSGDQEDIEKLWRQKRGEQALDDLSDVLLIQMGVVLESLVLDWFEFKTGYIITDDQLRCVHDDFPHLTSTLDGQVRQSIDGEVLGIVEAKFMMPFRWSLDAAVAKYMPQVQHNMFVAGYDRGWLTIVNGAANFAQVEIEADPFYQCAMLRELNRFWECVETGRVPGNPVIRTPKVDPVHVVNMTGNNAWAACANTLLETQDACERYEEAKKAIKAMVPPDVREAAGYGVSITRAKNGRMTVNLDEAWLEEARQRVAALAG